MLKLNRELKNGEGARKNKGSTTPRLKYSKRPEKKQRNRTVCDSGIVWQNITRQKELESI